MTSTPVEEPPDLERFTHAEAWTLGRDLAERAQREGLPVTISILLGSQRVFHAALPGTSADNDGWVARKSAVVRHFDQSSLGVTQRYPMDRADFHRIFALPEAAYAASGGAVPIRVRGTLVGVLAVSGLDDAADHQLAIDALSALAGRSDAAKTENGRRP